MPSFFSVAKQPKWIGALFLALGVAAIFALLSQWQLDRAFTKDSTTQTAYNIEKVDVVIDIKNVYIVANRLSGADNGYWLIANSTTTAKKSQTLALGWSAELAKVEEERTALMQSDLSSFNTKLEGVFIPTEAPRPQSAQQSYIFDSLSLAQLLNIYSPDKPVASEPQILALNGQSQASAWPPLEPINITYVEGQKVNWLSAFYFLEWLLFAGFAVFLWWRLVRDEQILLANDSIAEKVN